MGESITPKPNEGIGTSSSTPTAPAASSLYEIVRRHCRERLLVRPLFWTNRHLELLRISFDEPSLAPETDRLDYYTKRTDRFPGKRVMGCYLRRFHLQECREEYIRASFRGCESPFKKALIVNVDGFHTPVVCEGINLREAGSDWSDKNYPAYPICAYIDSSRIEEWRRESLHLRSCNPQNAPVYAMLCRKLENLRPQNMLKEPYVAGLLVALAQYRRYVLEAIESEDLLRLEIYPVLYSLETQSSIYLYKADIPSSFLDMLERPAIAPPRPPHISIQVFEIPRESVDTFRDRILALIFPTNLDPPFKMENNRKRKRS